VPMAFLKSTARGWPKPRHGWRSCVKQPYKQLIIRCANNENAAAWRIRLEHFSRQHVHKMCCRTQHVHVLKETCIRNMCWGWSIYQGNMCTQHVLLYATCARVQGNM
jgi:hypothetical protein